MILRLTIYSRLLNRYSEKRGAAYEAVNSGLSGSQTRQAPERLYRDVCSRSPLLVVIRFGINDSWIDKEQEDISRIPLEEYCDNLNKLITEISAIGSGVLLMTPNQIGAKYEEWRCRRLERYANAARRAAEAHSTDFIDIWKLYDQRQPVDDLLLDGMPGHLQRRVGGGVLRKNGHRQSDLLCQPPPPSASPATARRPPFLPGMRWIIGEQLTNLVPTRLGAQVISGIGARCGHHHPAESRVLGRKFCLYSKFLSPFNFQLGLEPSFFHVNCRVIC